MSNLKVIGYIFLNFGIRSIQRIVHKYLVNPCGLIYNILYFRDKNLIKTVKVIILYPLELEAVDFKRLILLALQQNCQSIGAWIIERLIDFGLEVADDIEFGEFSVEFFFDNAIDSMISNII